MATAEAKKQPTTPEQLRARRSAAVVEYRELVLACHRGERIDLGRLDECTRIMGLQSSADALAEDLAALEAHDNAVARSMEAARDRSEAAREYAVAAEKLLHAEGEIVILRNKVAALLAASSTPDWAASELRAAEDMAPRLFAEDIATRELRPNQPAPSPEAIERIALGQDPVSQDAVWLED
jgi:hypothetical protein